MIRLENCRLWLSKCRIVKDFDSLVRPFFTCTQPIIVPFAIKGRHPVQMQRDALGGSVAETPTTPISWRRFPRLFR